MAPPASNSEAEAAEPAAVDEMAATVERWIAAARNTIELASTSLRGVSSAAISGISLPCYNDLVHSYTQLMGPSDTISQSSFSLRRSVESALFQRTASVLLSTPVSNPTSGVVALPGSDDNTEPVVSAGNDRLDNNKSWSGMIRCIRWVPLLEVVGYCCLTNEDHLFQFEILKVGYRGL